MSGSFCRTCCRTFLTGDNLVDNFLAHGLNSLTILTAKHCLGLLGSHLVTLTEQYIEDCLSTRIPCRYADLLDNEMDKLEGEMKEWKQQDEDVLSYALFPQVATDFFKYRQAQQEKVDMTQADTKNGAYPV